jgi:hypothetical protein
MMGSETYRVGHGIWSDQQDIILAKDVSES